MRPAAVFLIATALSIVPRTGSAWDDTGVTVVQGDFVPYVKLTYFGTLPDTVDISPLPEGNAWVGVGAWDGSTSGFAPQAFMKAAGQTQLVLTSTSPLETVPEAGAR